MQSRFIVSTIVALGLSSAASQAALATFSIGSGYFTAADATTLVPAGTLFQLVNLGADGIFNPISLGDGDTSQFGQWVSGDDTVITASNAINGIDFQTGAAFDLTNGPDSPGVLDRAFQLDVGVVPSGTKIGVRWFPGLQATNFASITLSAGQTYGEFTRQEVVSSPGYKLWLMPAQGASDPFDPLLTTNTGIGSDPVSAGSAQFTIIPEPASIGLALIGMASVLGIRRRRS